GAKKRPAPSGMVTAPDRWAAAASPPRIATTAATAISRLRRYIHVSLGHEVVDCDGPVVVDLGYALDFVVLGQVGRRDRAGGEVGVTREVRPGRRQRLSQPRVRLHVLHLVVVGVRGDRPAPRRGAVQ